jgi:hypothetical protein
MGCARQAGESATASIVGAFACAIAGLRFRGPGRHSKSHIVFGVEEGYWLHRGRGKVEGVK